MSAGDGRGGLLAGAMIAAAPLAVTVILAIVLACMTIGL